MTEQPTRPVHAFPTRAAIEQDPELVRTLIGAGFDPHSWGAHEPVPATERASAPVMETCPHCGQPKP
jgi:hypothetical protein